MPEEPRFSAKNMGKASISHIRKNIMNATETKHYMVENFLR